MIHRPLIQVIMVSAVMGGLIGLGVGLFVGIKIGMKIPKMGNDIPTQVEITTYQACAKHFLHKNLSQSVYFARGNKCEKIAAAAIESMVR